jgi:hypothetical protein
MQPEKLTWQCEGTHVTSCRTFVRKRSDDTNQTNHGAVFNLKSRFADSCPRMLQFSNLRDCPCELKSLK